MILWFSFLIRRHQLLHAFWTAFCLLDLSLFFTNLVVLYGGRRIYARDQLGGRWHRHSAEAPDVHDTSADGSRSVELAEFLDEAEAVLAAMDLP